MTDLCGLKPQFDHEGAEDGIFFSSLMEAIVYSGSYCWGYDVCLVSQLNIMEQMTSEIYF